MRKEATMRPPLPRSIRYALLGFLAAATAVFATENVWTARGPDGISWVNDVAIADGKAYAATLNGVFRSMDEGASWQSLGLGGRWIDQIAVGGGAIFVRTGGELHVSNDEGQTWSRAVYPINAFAVDPVDPSTLYAALQDGVVVKSEDSGATWHLASRQMQNQWTYFMVADAQGIYAANYGGLFRSQDGGVTWNLVSPPSSDGSFSALTAGTEGVYIWSHGSFCRTADSAATWTCTPTPRIFIRVVEAPSASHDETTRLFAATDQGLLQSTDRGVTWTPVSGEPGSAAYINGLAYDMSTSLLLAGNDRRMFRSLNRGGTWEPANSGLRSSFIQALALDPSDSSRLWAGINGYGPNGPGLFHSTDGGLTWSSPPSSPPTLESLAIDPHDPATLYVGRGENVYRTEDGAETWTTSSRTGGYSVTTLAADPATPRRVYVGTSDGLIRSEDGASTFGRIPKVPQTVYSLLFDQHRPGRIYAGSYYDVSSTYYSYYSYPSGGSIFVSVDNGETFTRGADNLGSFVTALALDPFQEKVIYAGTGSNGIYRSVDGGTHWSHVGTSSFGGWISSLVADPVRPGHLYAATTTGVFRTQDGAHTWEPFSTGLSAGSTGPLLITPDGNRLHLGTGGAGIFDLDLEQGAPFSCTPSSTRLCLVDNRYALDVVAPRKGEGRYDPGTAHSLSDRSGYFALPNVTGDSNLPEVIVKMLAPGTFGRPGAPVFYASMTSAPYVLTVTDTTTGQRKLYSSNRGSPLCGGADQPFGQAAEPAWSDSKAGAAETPLTLLGGRFTVTLQARNPHSGQTVGGQAKSLSDRSGYFGLAGVTGDNLFPEVVVKMVDGRPINGNFWFFHSNLTSLDYTLTVTDQVSGAVRTFQSPGSFCGDADISLEPN
jgi:photosystem II stability/assembly factor-like uncharacterized protein